MKETRHALTFGKRVPKNEKHDGRVCDVQAKCSKRRELDHVTFGQRERGSTLPIVALDKDCSSGEADGQALQDTRRCWGNGREAVLKAPGGDSYILLPILLRESSFLKLHFPSPPGCKVDQ
jgi:hypothetical protein